MIYGETLIKYKKNTTNQIVFYFFGFLYRSRGSKGPPGRVRSRFRRWRTGVLQLQTCGAHGLRSAEAPRRVRSRFRRWKTDVLQLQTCGDMSKLHLPDTLMPWRLLRAWVSKDCTRPSPPKAGPAGGTTWEQRKNRYRSSPCNDHFLCSGVQTFF